MYAARAAYIAGCTATSNVEAGLRFGVPTMGTMAHSFVMSFDDEIDAFRHYLERFPEAATLLIDTYDTVAAARSIVAAGLRPAAVRLDSGDLAQLSRAVRLMLDEGGLGDVRIFASGDLDEWAIARLLADGAPLDAFGVGTRLATSSDAPSLGGVYKLVEMAAGDEPRGRVKTSAGKATYPGRKQVWRRRTAAGEASGDVIAHADEAPIPSAAPLLERVMRGGLCGPRPDLEAIRQHCRSELATLPPSLLRIDQRAAYPVRFSDRLREARQRLAGMHTGR
jgi:nicotinate phosphoribosyltransferase